MAPTDTLMSEEEYLIREPEADYKREFRDGRVVAMAGASPAHSRITVNLIREIDSQLKGRPCTTFSSDTRLKVARARFYTYPDLSVVCGTPAFDARDVNALLNPTLLVEVLSPSTEAYDRGEKFGDYRQLGTLQEYVLVAQDKVCVECFRREGKSSWPLRTWRSLDDVVELASIGCRVAVRDIYDKVLAGEEPGIPRENG